MTSRCLFITSSYSSVRLRIWKLCCSTRFWACSMERLSSGCSSSWPSSRPIFSMYLTMRVGAEQAHQVVLERDEEVRGAGVALARAAAAQLAVDAAGLVALGADDVQAAGLGDAGAEFDVGAAAGHVGGDGDGAALAGARDDLRFLLVVLGVEHGVDDAVALAACARACSLTSTEIVPTSIGPAFAVDVLDLLEHRVVFLAPGLIDGIVGVVAGDGPVGRDHQHAQLVDVEELGGLRFRRAGHAGQLAGRGGNSSGW